MDFTNFVNHPRIKENPFRAGGLSSIYVSSNTDIPGVFKNGIS
jgi:hypothetical protein